MMLWDIFHKMWLENRKGDLTSYMFSCFCSWFVSTALTKLILTAAVHAVVVPLVWVLKLRRRLTLNHQYDYYHVHQLVPGVSFSNSSYLCLCPRQVPYKVPLQFPIWKKANNATDRVCTQIHMYCACVWWQRRGAHYMMGNNLLAPNYWTSRCGFKS